MSARSIFIAAAFLFAAGAQAQSDYCHSTYCDPNAWIWYPRTPPGQPYGRDVKLSPDGEWIDRGGHRVWANLGTRKATVISAANSDKRNGELAYQTAYGSYLFGKNNGLNQVERLPPGGRWVTKITTGDGIVLYKDAAQNVVVQTPEGKWHVTDRRGEYASTSYELNKVIPEKEMIAVVNKPVAKKPKKLAKAKKPAKKIAERKIASASPPPAEAAPTASMPAPPPAPDVAAEAPASPPPTAGAPAAAPPPLASAEPAKVPAK
ncbi:MAG: hypothetical protein ACXVB9_16675 [Bdellovibrionota bacterium]